MSLLLQNYYDFTKYKKFPYSRLAMITIRDPKQKLTMPQVRTWIKRYSKDYTIVSSPLGGVHYHALVGINAESSVIRGKKGIHLNIKYLNDTCASPLCYDSAEDVQDRLKVKFYRNKTFERLTRYLLTDHVVHLSQINAMIQCYWKKKAAKAKRVASGDKKMKKIMCVVDYLNKNVNENLGFPSQYDHYLDCHPRN